MSDPATSTKRKPETAVSVWSEEGDRDVSSSMHFHMPAFRFALLDLAVFLKESVYRNMQVLPSRFTTIFRVAQQLNALSARYDHMVLGGSG